MDKPLPDYLSRSVPVPAQARAPWYKNTFPTYAGIFLWVGFYLKLPGPTLGFAGIGISLLGLVVAGLLCFALYYYVPAVLGMETGQPLYVVASSTFGAAGGYLIPGILMGLLQIGWGAVIATVASQFIMTALNSSRHSLQIAIIVVWLACLGWVAAKGIHYVGRFAKVANWVPFAMIVLVCWWNKGGISSYRPSHHQPLTGFLNVLAITIGYFATGGAAGADFGMSNRNRRDIFWGGLTGVLGGALVAGGLAVLSVAGYLGRTAGATDYDFSAAIASVGPLAPIMFFLFAGACMVPTCFSCFIASNSFSTMFPRIPRGSSTLFAVSVSAVLAITGLANNLLGFFGIVGASFGPICGAMLADYLLAGRRWSGPRRGINWAGYLAWAVGFAVGIPQHIPGLPAAWARYDNLPELYSLVAGFLVYLLLSKAGLSAPLVSGPGIGAKPQPLAETA